MATTTAQMIAFLRSIETGPTIPTSVRDSAKDAADAIEAGDPDILLTAVQAVISDSSAQIPLRSAACYIAAAMALTGRVPDLP